MPHKDTPRGGDMLGTLVVCLPAQFSKGAFVVKHQGVFQTYDWGHAIRDQAEPTRIHWAAFFGDVDHQIERAGGLRVTLTYLIRHGGDAAPGAAPAREAIDTLVQLKLRVMLDDRRFLAKGGTLAFPCSHLYHHDARFRRKQQPVSRQTVSALKGRDHEVTTAAMAAVLEVALYPYMIETALTRAGNSITSQPRASALLCAQMDPTDLENALDVRAGSEDAGDFDVVWVDPPPHFDWQLSIPRFSPPPDRTGGS